MNKEFMTTKHRGGWLLLILIIILCTFFVFNGPYKEYKIKEITKGFLENPKIKAIHDYYESESTNYVTLELRGELHREIKISNFDFSIFSKSEDVVIKNINEITLICMMEKNSYGVDVYLNSFMKNSPLNIKIENVNGLVENYDNIYNYVLTFPTKPEDARLVNMDNRVDKNKNHWCYIKKLNSNI